MMKKFSLPTSRFFSVSLLSLFLSPLGYAKTQDSYDYDEDSYSQAPDLPQKAPPLPAKKTVTNTKKNKSSQYAVLPLSKTLPKGIFRVDELVANSFGSSGFDSNKNKTKVGVSLNRWASVTQLQYGLTNTVSLAVGVPYITANRLSINGSQFMNSDFYLKYYNKVVSQLAQNLAATPLCGGSVASCQSYITSGQSLPVAVPIVLPSGEQSSLASGIPIKDQLRNLLLYAAAPTGGANGLGDMQVGVQWNMISAESHTLNMPLYFAIGGGLRVPTGQFDLPSALRAPGGDQTTSTGGGTYDALFRWDLDYVVTPGVILSWQHQMEYSLTNVHLGRSSMLNSTSKNQANAAAVTSVGGQSVSGDGVSNDLTFSRNGIHQIGFLQAAWGLGNIADKVKWLGTYTQAKYNIAAQSYLNGQPIYAMGDQFYLGDSSMHPDLGYEQYYSAVIGTKVSGLSYFIPVELTAEFEYPFVGKNRIVSPMNAQAMVSVYF